jgi:hypothetical protein
VGCLDNGDCNAPAVCNQATKTCVGCTKNADCKGSTVCDAKTKTCVGCISSASCTFDASKKVCDTATKTCVGCLTSANCTSAGKKVCDAANKNCVACLNSADCVYASGQTVCSTSTKTCVACVSSADCSGTAAVCDTSSNTCVACLGSSDCTYDSSKQVCDVGKQVCVGCLTSGDCSTATTPICDSASTSCRACAQHKECPDELCRQDGSCPAAASIAYVDCSGGGGTGSGTKADPYAQIASALGQKALILVRKSICSGKLEVKSSGEIYGAAGATLSPGGCDQLQLENGVTVLLSGFTINGNVLITNTGTQATLIENTIGPSSCVGVTMDSGTKLNLRRNHIFKHTGGGVQVRGNFAVVNNFIVQNGTSTASWGGVRLNPDSGATTTEFANNTVADNTSKGGHPGQAAIRCEKTLKIVNSIVWGNTLAQSAAGQLSPNCMAAYSDIQGLSGPLPDANKNISSFPLFKIFGLGATPWHLSNASPCRGKADPSSAPAIDYDGDPRSTTTPDIGADEVP